VELELRLIKKHVHGDSMRKLAVEPLARVSGVLQISPIFFS
jgi:hypothetical protein